MNLSAAKRVLSTVGLSIRATGSGSDSYAVSGVLTRHTQSKRGTTQASSAALIALAEEITKTPGATGVRWGDDGSLSVERA